MYPLVVAALSRCSALHKLMISFSFSHVFHTFALVFVFLLGSLLRLSLYWISFKRMQHANEHGVWPGPHTPRFLPVCSPPSTQLSKRVRRRVASVGYSWRYSFRFAFNFIRKSAKNMTSQFLRGPYRMLSHCASLIYRLVYSRYIYTWCGNELITASRTVRNIKFIV